MRQIALSNACIFSAFAAKRTGEERAGKVGRQVVEKTRKKWKKVLTRCRWCGILTELSTRTASVNDETKKLEKT